MEVVFKGSFFDVLKVNVVELFFISRISIGGKDYGIIFCDEVELFELCFLVCNFLILIIVKIVFIILIWYIFSICFML